MRADMQNTRENTPRDFYAAGAKAFKRGWGLYANPGQSATGEDAKMWLRGYHDAQEGIAQVSEAGGDMVIKTRDGHGRRLMAKAKHAFKIGTTLKGPRVRMRKAKAQQQELFAAVQA